MRMQREVTDHGFREYEADNRSVRGSGSNIFLSDLYAFKKDKSL